jgi:hypothetical protein
MSLSSDQLSIVSLGVSCQVSHQLRRNVELLARALDLPDLKISPSYFDNVGTPVASLLSLLSRTDDPDWGVPASMAEITMAGQFPYWPKEEIWLGHYFREHGMLDGKVDIPATFARDQAVIRFMREKFRRLEELSRDFVFVIGNAQENLESDVLFSEKFRDWFYFNADRMRALRDLLVGRFGSRFLALLVIENDKSWSGAWSLERVLRGHVGAPGWKGHWTGIDENWTPVLVSSLGAVVRGTANAARWTKIYGVAGVTDLPADAEMAASS